MVARRICCFLVALGCAATWAADPATPGGGANDPQSLLRWYRSHTLAAYKKAEYTNELWDKAAIEALELFSRVSADPKEQTRSNQETLRRQLLSAVDAGCQDPLIRYLRLEYAPDEIQPTPDKIIAAWVRVCSQIDKTRYTTAFKFYPNLKAWKTWNDYHTRDWKHPPPQYNEAMRCYHQAYRYAAKIVKETNTPIEVISDVCQEMLEFLKGDQSGGEKTYYDAIKNDLARNWPQNAHVSLLRGIFNFNDAWLARGHGSADSVTAKGWQEFGERLSVAEDALEKAWRLDPTLKKVPVVMMAVENGQGQGRERLELWFRRAMALDTNSHLACSVKLFYLMPQWHGSAKEMIQFGRECLASTNWGPDVSWTLVHAHEYLVSYSIQDAELKKNYWKNPAVWADLKLACEKNLIINPRGTNFARHAYIEQARRCEQWDVVSQQLRLLTSTNYEHFGGSAAFDLMARTAAEKAGTAK